MMLEKVLRALTGRVPGDMSNMRRSRTERLHLEIFHREDKWGFITGDRQPHLSRSAISLARQVLSADGARA